MPPPLRLSSAKKPPINGISRLLAPFSLKMPQYTSDHIRTKLLQELSASHVEVIDESDGCGGKFSCVIVSDKFRGKPLLQRHRLVNSVLQEELKSIHAFSQKTYTPEQWEQQ